MHAEYGFFSLPMQALHVIVPTVWEEEGERNVEEGADAIEKTR